MRRVFGELVQDALRELSDEQAQHVLWRSEGEPEVSSLAEARSRLWDDSGLGDAMDRGVVYDEAIDARLRQLRKVLNLIDPNAPVSELLADAEMNTVRSLAAGLLQALQTRG